jgi:hypothetical protein
MWNQITRSNLQTAGPLKGWLIATCTSGISVPGTVAALYDPAARKISGHKERNDDQEIVFFTNVWQRAIRNRIWRVLKSDG